MSAMEMTLGMIPDPDLRIAPVVSCPNCHHGINVHDMATCAACHCHWTPNDIAVHRLTMMEEAR
jgi:hypothetical protein